MQGGKRGAASAANGVTWREFYENLILSILQSPSQFRFPPASASLLSLSLCLHLRAMERRSGGRKDSRITCAVNYKCNCARGGEKAGEHFDQNCIHSCSRLRHSMSLSLSHATLSCFGFPFRQISCISRAHEATAACSSHPCLRQERTSRCGDRHPSLCSCCDCILQSMTRTPVLFARAKSTS